MSRLVTLTDCVKEWLKISPRLIDKYELQFRGYNFSLMSLEDKKDKYRIKFHTRVVYPKDTMGASRIVIWRYGPKGLGIPLIFEIHINDTNAELLGREAIIFSVVEAANPEFFNILGGWFRSIVRE